MACSGPRTPWRETIAPLTGSGNRSVIEPDLQALFHPRRRKPNRAFSADEFLQAAEFMISKYRKFIRPIPAQRTQNEKTARFDKIMKTAPDILWQANRIPSDTQGRGKRCIGSSSLSPVQTPPCRRRSPDTIEYRTQERGVFIDCPCDNSNLISRQTVSTQGKVLALFVRFRSA
ncbi:MAG: hypothetical protein WCI20_04725 [bacterium]